MSSLQTHLAHELRVPPPRRLIQAVVEEIAHVDARLTPGGAIDEIQIQVEHAAVTQRQKLFILFRWNEARAAATTRQDALPFIIPASQGRFAIVRIP